MIKRVSTNISHENPRIKAKSEQDKYELVWTNPDPTQIFEAQTIQIDLSKYDSILVVYYYRITSSEGRHERTFFIDKGSHYMDQFSGAGSSSLQYDVRRIYTYKDRLVFTSAIRKSTRESSAGNENNEYVIPAAIFGIKRTNAPLDIIQFNG